MSEIISYSSMSRKINYEEGYINSNKVESFLDYSHYHTNKVGNVTVVAHKKCCRERDKVIFASLNINDFRHDIKSEIMGMSLLPRSNENVYVNVLIPTKQMRSYSTLARNRLFRGLVRGYLKEENNIVTVNEMSADNWLYLVRLKKNWNKKQKNTMKKVLNSVK